MRIAAIIVNYGTPELALQAVASLLEDSDPPEGPLAVHLVDNASPGDDAAVFAREIAARGWQGRVTLHASEENLGFGRGNNLVLEDLAEDPPDAVFLLNPDAAVEGGALRRLAAALAADPGAGAAGAGLISADGTPEAAAFHFPTPSREILRALNTGVAWRLFSREPMPVDTEAAGSVDWLAGAAVLFRWAALAETGFFDPGFFLYYEEVDLMRRMTEGGWRMLYVPQARATHQTGAATRISAHDDELHRRPVYYYDSWRRYHLKAQGRAGAFLTAIALPPASLAHRAISRLRGRRGWVAKGFERDHMRHVVWPLIRGGK